MAPHFFDIVDISHPDFKAEKYGLKFEDVNKNMHAQTPEGELCIGVDAFAHIWDRIDKYNWAARLIRNPIINPVARLGYKFFALIRPYLPKRK